MSTSTELTLADLVNLKPSTKTVYEYLRSGHGLSNVIALTVLGVGSLSSRVSELTKLGLNITSTMTTSPKPEGKRYVVYRLAGVRKSKAA